MNEVLNDKPVRNGGLIAKRVLLILSIVFYSGISLFLLYLLVDIIKVPGDDQGLGFAIFIVLLLVYGTILIDFTFKNVDYSALCIVIFLFLLTFKS